MTDQPTTPTEPTPEPEPTPEVKAEPTRKAGPPKAYALYDLSHLRFVGGTHDTKAKADDKSLKVKGHRYEVREV